MKADQKRRLEAIRVEALANNIDDVLRVAEAMAPEFAEEDAAHYASYRKEPLDIEKIGRSIKYLTALKEAVGNAENARELLDKRIAAALAAGSASDAP